MLRGLRNGKEGGNSRFTGFRVWGLNRLASRELRNGKARTDVSMAWRTGKEHRSYCRVRV